MTKEDLKSKLNEIYDLLIDVVIHADDLGCTSNTINDLIDSKAYMYSAIVYLTNEIRDE